VDVEITEAMNNSLRGKWVQDAPRALEQRA
jgi:hypothetical protein